jgi:hypothetical protein
VSREATLTVIWGAAVAMSIGALTTWWQQWPVAGWAFAALAIACTVAAVWLHRRAPRPRADATRQPVSSWALESALSRYRSAEFERIAAETAVRAAQAELEAAPETLARYRRSDLITAEGRLERARADERHRLLDLDELRETAGLGPFATAEPTP